MNKIKYIEKKITANGTKVSIFDKVVTKEYSKTYIVMMSFSTHKEALKEYRKYRRGYKQL